jgi:hypothetical protein
VESSSFEVKRVMVARFLVLWERWEWISLSRSAACEMVSFWEIDSWDCRVEISDLRLGMRGLGCGGWVG